MRAFGDGSQVVLPPGWMRVRLKDVLTYCNRGVAPNYVDAAATDTTAISQKCVAGGAVDAAFGRPMDPGQDPGSAALRCNDVLVNSTGRGTLGRVGIVDGITNDSRLVADGHVTVLRAHRCKLEPRYLNYMLGTDDFYRFANETLAVGSTNQTELSRDQLRCLPICLPTLQEQQRIADYLDVQCARIDVLIDEVNVSIGLLSERRVAAVFDAVTGASVAGSRRGGVPWVESVPADFDVAKLTSVAALGSGHTPARNRPELWEDCTIPWITTGEVWQIRSDVQEVLTETREKISALGVAGSAAVVHPAGTVVLCRTAASAGYSAMMGLDMATSQDFVTWTCGPRLNPRFLLYCLRAMRRDLLERLATGSTHRTIYMPEIKSLVVPLPSPDEQARIVDRLSAELDSIDQTRTEFGRQVALLRERRQALITAAVTGQFDVSSAA